MSLQADARIPLTNSDGSPLAPWQLRDAIALTVHQLLDSTDPATAHDVEYPASNPGDAPYKVTVCDPYVWDLSTFRLKAKADGDVIVIKVFCEVE